MAAPDFAPRRAPDKTFRADWRDELGNVHSIKANANAVVTIKTAGQKRAADAFGLPEAREPAKAPQKRSTRASTRATVVDNVTAPAAVPDDDSGKED